MDRVRLPDDELLRRTPHDAECFGVLYDRHARWVLAYALRQGLEPQAAMDVVAETFAAALESAPGFRSRGGGAVAWLQTIARNEVTDRRRRGGAELAAMARLGLERPVLTDASIERVVGEAEALVAQLPAEEREAVFGRVVEDRSYADLARRAGVPQTAMRKRVSRGLARLRRAATEETR
jgi:RNA polymerase sigma factor (sigma-70 family)